MPVPVHCNGCGKTFSSTQYFHQHLSAKVECADAFVDRAPVGKGLRRMTPHSRRFRELFKQGVTIEKFIANIDLVTEDMDRKRAAMAAGDFSEFEFNDDDENLRATKTNPC